MSSGCEETGSTNADLVRLARFGEADRVVLAADHQTAGRGRLDRKWEAPAGVNLLFSMLLRNPPANRHEVTQRVALAAQEACAEVAGAIVELKWPNDLLIDGKKLAGVLAEAGESEYGPFVVVGVGLNVGWAPSDGAKLGELCSRQELLAAVLTAFDALPDDIHATYRNRLGTLGQLVRVELPAGDLLVGRATDVEADGRLVLLDDCALTHRIDTGDVVHLRRLT